jgi:hypothetical protein
MHNALNSTDKNKSILLKTVTLMLVLVWFSSCQDIQKPERPKNLIPEDKMVEVLIDVHLFNAAKNVNRLPLQQTGMSPHEFIYDRHNIDSIQFEKSNAYYGTDINAYERIHLRVKKFLDNKKTEIDTLIAREKRRQDSIKIVEDSLRLKKIFRESEEPAVLQMVKPVKTDSLN